MVKWVDIIFYIALIVFFVWIVGKAVGVIHSPAWVEMIPYGSALVAAGAMFEKLRNTSNKVEDIDRDVRGIDKRVVKIEENICLREPVIQKFMEGQVESALSKKRSGK